VKIHPDFSDKDYFLVENLVKKYITMSAPAVSLTSDAAIS